MAVSRNLGFSKTYNFRDVGGYTGLDGRSVRWRRIFRSDALHRLGPEDAAVYDLDYRISAGVVAQAITPDEVTTRYSLNGTADFALTGPGGAMITQGRVSSFTSYSTTVTTISTLAAEGDARERLALMLADQVVTRLLAAASGLPD